MFISIIIYPYEAIYDIIAWCLVKYITSKADEAPDIGSAFL